MKLNIILKNLCSLKTVIAAGITDAQVEIVKIPPKASCSGFCNNVSTSSPISRPPVLELPSSECLFSANAICWYLFHQRESGNNTTFDPITEEWLEWESNCLQPYVTTFIANFFENNKLNDALFSTLMNHLQYLDSFLTSTPHFPRSSASGTLPGIGDVVIWSTVYPVITDEKLGADTVKKFSSLCRWFHEIGLNESFKEAVRYVFGEKKPSACKETLIEKDPLLHNFALSTQRGKLVPQVINSSDVEMNTSQVEEDVISQEEMFVVFKNWLKGKSFMPKKSEEKFPILPQEGERNILVTSALPYVNNVPHLGNIIGAVLSADVFARYCRNRNYVTLYICGTDEYGTATETKALEEGVTPWEICNKYHRLHKEVYQWFNISFDYFGRTTTDWQKQIAQDIFLKLYAKNYLFEDTVEQLFCEKCHRFLADRFVLGVCPFCLYDDARGDQCDKCGRLINAVELKEPKCKVCSSTPILKTSRHLFLDLPKLQPDLHTWLDQSCESGYWTNTAKVITYSWLKEGLKPRCLTRDLKWGIPVPVKGYEGKVFYVWFDAPIGYLSITASYTDQWENWWKQPEKVQLYQFMAKDNVPFHSIIFPASIIGTKEKFTMVNHLIAVEYLNYENDKFSKSRGIGVFGTDAKETGIPSDVWRFYLLSLRPESQDSSFSWNDLLLKNNSELLNNFGNFVNRALMFLANNFSCVIPEMKINEEDKMLLVRVNRELQSYIELMEKVKLRDAIRPVFSISRLGNQHIQSNKPWEHVKGSNEQRERAGTVMGLCANIACLLATLIEPYMPETSTKLKQQLNTTPDCHVITSFFTCCLPSGHKIDYPKPLFKKLETSFIEDLKKKFAGDEQPKEKSPSKKMSSKGGKSTSVVEPSTQIHDTVDQASLDHLTDLVAKQGNLVRDLKSRKAEKAEIEREVQQLLELKRQLALASGKDPNEVSGQQKKKNRKK
ncbi:methionine--tRNA ligase, cytoplasmic-like [Limulus polyphemus]|uniref:Methionine--tRNA ligase, cytoplasmic n=1 Tax=Limulus polyphemus TaxID=6850 RepID=A0ABM1BUG2_LIMPO|nr:methionine--tRNA ligase, cytoplasmic-like [Limulus polyphemus]